MPISPTSLTIKPGNPAQLVEFSAWKHVNGATIKTSASTGFFGIDVALPSLVWKFSPVNQVLGGTTVRGWLAFDGTAAQADAESRTLYLDFLLPAKAKLELLCEYSAGGPPETLDVFLTT